MQDRCWTLFTDEVIASCAGWKLATWHILVRRRLGSGLFLYLAVLLLQLLQVAAEIRGGLLQGGQLLGKSRDIACKAAHTAAGDVFRKLPRLPLLL